MQSQRVGFQASSGVGERRGCGLAPKICAPASRWLTQTSAHCRALVSQSIKDLDSYGHGQGGIRDDASLCGFPLDSLFDLLAGSPGTRPCECLRRMAF